MSASQWAHMGAVLSAANARVRPAVRAVVLLQATQGASPLPAVRPNGLHCRPCTLAAGQAARTRPRRPWHRDGTTSGKRWATSLPLSLAGCPSGGNWKSASASLLRLAGCGLQSKKANSDKKLSEIMQQMEQLELEKKELELKNRILETDLQDWQDHVEELWGKPSLIQLV